MCCLKKNNKYDFNHYINVIYHFIIYQQLYRNLDNYKHTKLHNIHILDFLINLNKIKNCMQFIIY